MKKLKPETLETLRLKLVKALNENSDTSEFDKPARVEFPLGEICGGSLTGFAWAWKLQGDMPKPEGLTGRERFNAQGLEGKIVKDVILYQAILMFSAAPKYRLNVFA